MRDDDAILFSGLGFLSLLELDDDDPLAVIGTVPGNSDIDAFHGLREKHLRADAQIVRQCTVIQHIGNMLKRVRPRTQLVDADSVPSLLDEVIMDHIIYAA